MYGYDILSVPLSTPKQNRVYQVPGTRYDIMGYLGSYQVPGNTQRREKRGVVEASNDFRRTTAAAQAAPLAAQQIFSRSGDVVTTYNHSSRSTLLLAVPILSYGVYEIILLDSYKITQNWCIPGTQGTIFRYKNSASTDKYENTTDGCV